MTEEEIQQLLAEVEELLTELGLGFIVTQERALAAEGVSQSPTDPTGTAFDDGRFDEIAGSPLYLNQLRHAPGQRSGSRPRFKRGDVVVTPLNPRARLGILLDLIEVATAGTLAMERDVQKQLEELRRLALEHHNGGSDFAAAGSSDPWAETWDGTVVFMDPPEAELRGRRLPAWKLASAEARRASAFRVRSVLDTLNELRIEAGVVRGSWLTPHGRGNEGDWDL
ncbi:hypothetical protein [Micromonospora sp. NBC_00421]|uniref:hypothetical protein n=1 Tax=Micromonospora sp. NBC_00421 TaxID=2975976 RepID=UPI002E22586A